MGFFAFFCAEVRFERIERIGQCLVSGSAGPGHEAERAERVTSRARLRNRLVRGTGEMPIP